MKLSKVQRRVQAGMVDVKSQIEDVLEYHNQKMNQPIPALTLFLGSIPHFVVLLFTVYIVWIARPASSLFSWHPTLMCFAFVLLMSESVYLFSRWSSPAIKASRQTKIQGHWILQTATLIVAFTGLTVILVNKQSAGKQHFTSWHGLVGIISCVFLLNQVTGGFVQLNYHYVKRFVRLVTLKKLHAAFGTLTYAGGMVTIFLGMFSTWATNNISEETVWYICAICPIFLFGTVLFQVVKSYIFQ